MRRISLDYAKSVHKDDWFSHPVMGDCSFDTFERHKDNPIWRGTGIWEWPVNGFFYADPVSGNWYIYISLYCYGYLPLSGTIVAMKSVDRGVTWAPIGPVFDSQGMSLDYKATGSVDCSIVYENGTYHMIYSWGTSDLYTNGGIAYACSSSAEGPFIRAPHPITQDHDSRTHFNKIYVRSYAATLLKRNHDWLILTTASTKGNTGNTWALAAMTAAKPEGPYSHYQLLLYPQSSLYHPAPLEFFPVFVEGEYVYAPATSLGLNRNVQFIFRAKLEEANQEKAWELFQEGSGWHAVDQDSERHGIWGQTLAGQVIENELWVMYPALNDQMKGTINVARRPWKQPYSDGFVLSANRGPSASFLRMDYSEFHLYIRASSIGSGPFSLFWQWNAPVGVNHSEFWADTVLHALSITACLQLEVDLEEWRIIERLSPSDTRLLKKNPYSRQQKDTIELVVHQTESLCRVAVNGESIQLDLPAMKGRIGLHCAPGTITFVESFELNGAKEEECWVDILPTDGLMQAGQDVVCWDYETHDANYRFGFGYRSANRPSRFSSDRIHMTKWIFKGRAFQLWMPVKSYGKILIELDGIAIAGNESRETVLLPDGLPGSKLICHQEGLVDGYHAVKVTLLEGEMCCDSLSYLL